MKNNNKSWYKAGKIKDAHGLKGELFVIIFSKQASWCNKLKTVLLGEGVDAKEYDVVKVSPLREGLRLQVKNITDRNQSEDLRGLAFSIPSELLETKTGETIFLREVLHFAVLVEGKILGEVDEFSSNGPQDLLVVRANGNEYLIPFVEAFIKNIDYENKQIEMELPEGLLSVNQEDPE